MHEAISPTAVPLLCLCLIIIVTIIHHIFTCIFQTAHISAVKMSMGYEKKYELSFDNKITKSLKKLLDQAPLKSSIWQLCLFYITVYIHPRITFGNIKIWIFFHDYDNHNSLELILTNPTWCLSGWLHVDPEVLHRVNDTISYRKY